MVATPISSSTRYINPETTVILWVPSIASKAAPSRAELNAGTNLVGENAACDGWNVQGEKVETPDMGSRFTGSIDGRLTADDSSLDMYADVGGSDARSLMARGTAGYVVWMDGGDVAGRKMDVFPVRVLSVAKSNRSVEGSEAALLQFMYAISSAPAENVTIPA
jgi:hypothetical protein